MSSPETSILEYDNITLASTSSISLQKIISLSYFIDTASLIVSFYSYIERIFTEYIKSSCTITSINIQTKYSRKERFIYPYATFSNKTKHFENKELKKFWKTSLSALFLQNRNSFNNQCPNVNLPRLKRKFSQLPPSNTPFFKQLLQETQYERKIHSLASFLYSLPKKRKKKKKKKPRDKRKELKRWRRNKRKRGGLNDKERVPVERRTRWTKVF